jgi:hypothetical protein
VTGLVCGELQVDPTTQDSAELSVIEMEMVGWQLTRITVERALIFNTRVFGIIYNDIYA